MKNMKKIFALLVAVLMIAASVSALADAPTKGSITVNPNNNGQVYTLYKLFDAEITFKEKAGTNPVEYEQAAITYKLPAGKSLDTTGSKYFIVNSNGFIEKTEALTDSAMKSREFIDWVKTFGSTVQSAITASKDNDPNVKWENLDFGYYFVDSTLGSFLGIDSANPDATIQDKNNPPKLDKKIKAVKDASGADDGSIFAANDQAEIQFEGDGSNEHAIAQIGDTVTFSVDVTIKAGAEAYVLTDTMDNGLTAPDATAVTVKQGETDLKTGDKATVAVSGQTITVTFAQSYLDTITADTVVTMEYTATLNANAVVAVDLNKNKARLEWGHKPTKDYTEDESKVWTAKVGVNKKINSETGDPLAGAGFVVKNAANKYYKRDAATDVVTWVESIDAATERITKADGTIDAFEGLPNGTYTLVEKTVPAGYNKTADATFTINEANVTVDNLEQTKTVINNSGSTLPTTGGIGTTILYVAGSILVLAAVILLVTKRRMNAED